MAEPLDRERWQRIDRILDVALDLPPGSRAAYVDEACAGDAALRREVEELLLAADAPRSFLAAPAAPARSRPESAAWRAPRARRSASDPPIRPDDGTA